MANSEKEIACFDMVLNPWGFKFTSNLLFKNKKAIDKKVAKLYKDVNSLVELQLNKSVFESAKFVPLGTNPEQYLLQELPKEDDIQVKVLDDRFGVVASRFIPAGEPIIAVMGQVSVYNPRKVSSNIIPLGETIEISKNEELKHSYQLQIDNSTYGNYFRLIHQCCPAYSNAHCIDAWFQEQLYRILVATVDIEKGTEIKCKAPSVDFELTVEYDQPLPNCFCEGNNADKVHTYGERPKNRYKCTHWSDKKPCRERFATPFEKYHHEFFQHRVKGKVQCDECEDKKFTSFAGLYKHKKTQHDNNGIPEHLRKRL